MISGISAEANEGTHRVSHGISDRRCLLLAPLVRGVSVVLGGVTAGRVVLGVTVTY